MASEVAAGAACPRCGETDPLATQIQCDYWRGFKFAVMTCRCGYGEAAPFDYADDKQWDVQRRFYRVDADRLAEVSMLERGLQAYAAACAAHRELHGGRQIGRHAAGISAVLAVGFDEECIQALTWPRTEQPAAAYGRVVNGKAVTVSVERNPANDEPLYAGAPPRADAVDEAMVERAIKAFWSPYYEAQRKNLVTPGAFEQGMRAALTAALNPEKE